MSNLQLENGGDCSNVVKNSRILVHDVRYIRDIQHMFRITSVVDNLFSP